LQSSDSREVDPNPRIILDDLRKRVAAVWAAENDAGATVDVNGPNRPGCTTAATGSNRGCHLDGEHLLKQSSNRVAVQHQLVHLSWGYSALKTGLAYLPFTAALLIAAGAVTQLVPRIGARPLLLAGSAASTGGLYWLSRISEHDTYTSGVLGPTIVIGAGTALLFVTLSLVALNRVPEADSGVASSLLNTGQQLGGSVGLALLGTVAWTVVAHSIHTQAAVAARAGHPVHPGGPQAAAIYNHALATGFARGFLVAAGIALLTLAINITVIRIRRADLAGSQQPIPAAHAESS
jgi:Major Facilitator Superfamily